MRRCKVINGEPGSGGEGVCCMERKDIGPELRR